MAETTCAVDGCQKTGKMRRGWCAKHYQRWRAHGNVGSDGPRSCSDCSIEFMPTNARQGVCTPCRNSRRRSGKHRLIERKDCEWCGRTFEVRADNPQARGCSRACGIYVFGNANTSCEIRWVQCKRCDAWRTSRTPHDCKHETGPRPRLHCRVCGNQMESTNPTRRYCSTVCKLISHTSPHRSIWVINCVWCDTAFVSRVEHGAYCSKRCSRQARRGPERFVIPDTVRYSIYERDGWRCQLCSKKVQRGAAHNGKWGPSLDHIVPRSQGGSDSSDNLQLAHRICNSIKSDGVWGSGEQLSLLSIAAS